LRGLATGLEGLPRPAQRTIVLTIVAGAAAGALTVLGHHEDLSWLRIALIAVGIAAGELATVDLPHHHSSASGIRFTFGDTAMASGLLLASPGDVAIGISVGLLLWQIVDRAEPIKLLFNLGQYTLAGSCAALTFHAVSPALHGTEAQTVLSLAVAIVVFLALNTLTVGFVVATTTDDGFPMVVGRMLPTNGLVTGCNGALALLLVIVWEQNPWAVPALGAPLLLVYMASRLRVRAQLDRERSEAALAVERRLGETVNLDQIAEQVATGVTAIVGMQAAVWLHGQWRTPVPEGTGSCLVDPGAGNAQWSRADAFGVMLDETPAAAIGFGHGVLVAWEHHSRSTADATPWLERLARSAAVHVSRAEASAALERERATLRAVVDGTADGIFVLDDHGDVALWNPAMWRLSGIVEGTAVGQSIDTVLGDGPWRSAGIHDVARATEDGTEGRTWRVAVAKVQQDRDSGLLSIAVVHDVSEERRVARMKDDMLAVVSHELRTPLTPIKASAQLLSRRADQLDSKQRARLLAEIEQRADHLARLVEDLLLVAQLSSKASSQPRVVPTTANLMDVVREEVAHLGENYPDHTIELEGPDELVGTTDALRLRQVVANIVDNACKYSDAGSTVYVRLSEQADQALLEVADQGRGIPPEDRERIFERFERVEDPLNMTTSGAGLGLFIVRALTTALGGEARVEGAVGEGTTVIVRLPLLGVTENPVWDARPILRR
jgi:signal transduction histidine kinase